MKKTGGIITICEEMRHRYADRFGLPSYTVMTGAGIERHEVKPVVRVENMSYFGNLTFNRYLNIASIGRALDRINERTGRNIKLRVYSRNDNSTVRTEFEGISSLNMMGYLSGSDYLKAFFDSDVLIHTEAFDESCMNRVRYSVSTKIADSLASGIMLFAYGPDGIASMDHLKANGCAWIVESCSELENEIIRMLDSNSERVKITENGLKTAEKCHDSENNSHRVKAILEDAINGRLK